MSGAASSSPAAARLAATVVLLRDAAGGAEVLMVKRNRQVAFMGDAHVFPGGRVDEADGGGEAGLRAAAVRELREEAAIMFDPAGLVPLSHWITPSSEPKRYDTHFFLAQLPPGQVAKHDESETVAHLWATPAAVLAGNARGEIKLAPPTLRTLEELAAHATFAAARAWALGRPRLPIMPKLVPEAETLIIVLPWDPAYPSLPGAGDAIPADHPIARGKSSRFVLSEGRWWGRPPAV